MNIVFMGTPVYAVPCLQVLIDAGHNIQCVFTQPDKPQNRGQKLQPPPVKEFALEKGIEVFQPNSLRQGEDGARSHEVIKRLNPDCIVVVAYGQILPKDILDIPKYGCINVHASLLPYYRGASPINYCIMKGEEKTGVSVMYMSEGLDSGDVILQEEYVIPFDMKGARLHDELMAMGARLLADVMKQIESGTTTRTPQNHELTCYAPMITKQMCKIDWEKPALEIYNQIRGLADSPAAFAFLGEKRLKVYFAEIIETVDGAESAKSGTVISPEDFTVLCGDGKGLRLLDIQLEGGRRMDNESFLRGRKLSPDTVLR